MLFKGIDVQTRQTAQPNTIPSPVGGLNGRDPLANMPETDAYMMKNLFPGTSTCKVRPGCSIHQEPVGSPVSSLEVFAGGADQKILAFAGSNVFDVTAMGLATSLKSDLASDQIVSTMFATVADSAQWLIVTTGADIPMSFDGTALVNLAFTGMTEGPETINFVHPYMGRLFWGVEDRLGFYYLPPGQIQGAMEWYDLGQASNLGGRLQAIASYSQTSAGEGPQDYIVFISNRGEYFMFQGIDPGDANAWGIVGRFKGPEPIGRKCVLNYAGDLLVFTTEGLHQFSQIQKLGDTRSEIVALSSKLGDILLKNNINRDIWGWCMQLWPAGGWLIANAPDTNNPAGMFRQFVMNTVTQAWMEIDSVEWMARCWCRANGVIYFGRWDGSIRKVGGLSDNNEAIVVRCKQAYNYFKSPSHKHFKWAQFLVKSDAPVQLASKLSVDFMEHTPAVAPSAIGAGEGAIWDIDFWDDAVWASGPYTQRWIAAYGDYGVSASHWLEGHFDNVEFEWYSTEHVWEPAQGLL